jgi:hypothetical protein
MGAPTLHNQTASNIAQVVATVVTARGVIVAIRQARQDRLHGVMPFLMFDQGGQVVECALEQLPRDQLPYHFRGLRPLQVSGMDPAEVSLCRCPPTDHVRCARSVSESRVASRPSWVGPRCL